MCILEQSGNKMKNKNNSKTKKKKQNAIAPIRRKLEIKFDPEKRKEYLTGFHKRKVERRTFGLAMQQLKNRQDKLNERKERREAERQKMEEMELHKKIQRGEDDEDDENDDEDRYEFNREREQNDESSVINTHKHVDGDFPAKQSQKNDTEHTIVTYSTNNESSINSQFFGNEMSDVVVTTQYGLPDDDDSDDEDTRVESKNGIDKEQRWAGNVKHFMDELKGNLPGKKSAQKNQTKGKRKGKHGAGDMKGMGGAKNVKAAKKLLSRAETKSGKGKVSSRGGGRRGGRR